MNHKPLTKQSRLRVVPEHRQVLREPVPVPALQAPRHLNHELVEAPFHLPPLRRRHRRRDLRLQLRVLMLAHQNQAEHRPGQRPLVGAVLEQHDVEQRPEHIRKDSGLRLHVPREFIRAPRRVLPRHPVHRLEVKPREVIDGAGALARYAHVQAPQSGFQGSRDVSKRGRVACGDDGDVRMTKDFHEREVALGDFSVREHLLEWHR